MRISLEPSAWSSSSPDSTIHRLNHSLTSAPRSINPAQSPARQSSAPKRTRPARRPRRTRSSRTRTRSTTRRPTTRPRSSAARRRPTCHAGHGIPVQGQSSAETHSGKSERSGLEGTGAQVSDSTPVDDSEAPNVGGLAAGGYEAGDGRRLSPTRLRAGDRSFAGGLRAR